MLRSSPLSSRGQFGAFLTERGLTGTAVEIGTHRGEFADALLRTWPVGMLWCVDPWACPPGYDEQVKFLWGGTQQDAFDHCSKHLRKYYAGRFELIRMRSEDAVSKFHEGTLDFVYVDGDHRYEQVLQDLAWWWSKVKPGGILAGHDFVQPGEGHSWAGQVQKALFKFADRYSGPKIPDIQLIVEEGGLPWSYYMEKPK